MSDPVFCYMAKSRAGKAPGGVEKTNQDAHAELRNFCGIRNLWFFGVFDGHGINGHLVSGHVKQHLPCMTPIWTPADS